MSLGGGQLNGKMKKSSRKLGLVKNKSKYTDQSEVDLLDTTSFEASVTVRFVLKNIELCRGRRTRTLRRL